MNIKIILAQLNFTVGDIEGNKNKIIDAILKNQSNNISTVIIFPELSICSYPPEDLLHRPAFLQRIEVALNEIVNATKEIYVLVGYPKKSNGKIFNACSVIYNGEIIKTYFKQILPNYGVFDEKRYFEAGNSNCLFDINGISIAVTICEDIWEQQPTKNAADAGARILFNLNASPYHITKKQQRETLIKQRARENNLHIAYINLVGGQDELIFDGYSMLINANGENIFAAPQFTEGLYSYELDIENKEITNTVAIVDTPVTEEASIYQALVLGVRDYVKKNNFSGVVIGLSGGIDSALTTTIAVDALGAENVEVLIMPSRYTAQMSINDAIKQADTLGIRHETISIEPAFNSFLGSLFNRFENLPTDITEENIQARCRGILLMALSNKTGKLLLTTGNKSEMAVGYSTLYGDMCGGFAPLKDVWKTMVYKLAIWRNKDQEVIPANVIERPPSAELRENQVDQDSLPNYDILDTILEQYIEQDISPNIIIERGFSAKDVEHVVRMVDRNEYKRRQAAPGVRITQRAFGRDRRYPITSGYLEK